jgi:hypothetical protein
MATTSDDALELYNLLESRVFALEAKVAPEWAVKHERDSSKQWQARAHEKHGECTRLAEKVIAAQKAESAAIEENHRLQSEIDRLTLALKEAQKPKEELGFIAARFRGECGAVYQYGPGRPWHRCEAPAGHEYPHAWEHVRIQDHSGKP